jgi:hypothetical protein
MGDLLIQEATPILQQAMEDPQAVVRHAPSLATPPSKVKP